MAQKLKEDFKNAILSAAREEFLRKGCEEASMRDIAFKAGMTVGNLYRYFKDKDELIEAIIEPVKENTERLFSNIPEVKMVKKTRVFGTENSSDEYNRLFESLADNLSFIYGKYPDEFNILISLPEIKNMMILWFYQLMLKSKEEQLDADNESFAKVLSMATAESVVQGISVIFSVKNITDSKAKKLLIFYLKKEIILFDEETLKGLNDYD